MTDFSDEVIQDIASNIDIDDLPGDLPDIADLLGVFKTLLLARHMGCGRFYLKKWTEDSCRRSKDINRIVDIVGEEDARALIMYFCADGGTHVDIPKCDRFWRAWTHRVIAESPDRQLDLARRFNYSEVHIRRIKSRHKINDRQADLFGCNDADNKAYKKAKIL